MSRLTKKKGYPCIHCDSLECLGDCSGLFAIYNKLAHYEDLEEAGKLIALPCKPEEIVFAAHEDCATVRVAYNSIEHILYDLEAGWCIGYTKEEAEAKLAELKGE